MHSHNYRVGLGLPPDINCSGVNEPWGSEPHTGSQPSTHVLCCVGHYSGQSFLLPSVGGEIPSSAFPTYCPLHSLWLLAARNPLNDSFVTVLGDGKVPLRGKIRDRVVDDDIVCGDLGRL